MITKLENRDLTVILLPTLWDEEALAISLNSIATNMKESGLRVECLFAEMLPDGADVNAVHGQDVSALPLVLSTYLQYEGFSYVVEYGASARGLRRIIRCARGNHVCFLREGDQLGYRHTYARSVGDDDVTICLAATTPDSMTAHRHLMTAVEGITNLAGCAGLLASYDGALIVRREFLDRALAKASFDSSGGYPYFLNEFLTSDVIFRNGRVGFSDRFSVLPAAGNLASHQECLAMQSMTHWRARPYYGHADLEHNSLIAIDFIIDYLLQSIQCRLAGRPADAIKASFDYPGSRLFAGKHLTGKTYFKEFIVWAAGHAACLAGTPCPKPGNVANSLQPLNWRAAHLPSNAPTISMVSSAFRAQKLIWGFLQNLIDQTEFDASEVIVVSPETNFPQNLVVEFVGLFYPNISLIDLDKDPGLYECWNIAIRKARGEFITNVNVDDRRHRDHLHRIVGAMIGARADVGSAAVAVTESDDDIHSFASEELESRAGRAFEVWYQNAGAASALKGFNDFFLFNPDGTVKQSFNFPHCMPIWRRALHADLGYFNEAENGTYADFAFWLEAVSKGKSFIHLSDPLGLYLIDPRSHNRANANLGLWRKVANRFAPTGMSIAPLQEIEAVDAAPAPPRHRGEAGQSGKVNFGKQIRQDFGRHRSGWSYVLSRMGECHDEAAPVYCDAFIEKKFVWGSDLGDASSQHPSAYTTPWIGFIHVPNGVPSWFQFEQSNEQVFRSKAWQESLPLCKGLFCLTDHHRKSLVRQLQPEFPVDVLLHPTEIPDVHFDFDRYQANPMKRLVQVGWWLRKLNAISMINVPGHVSTVLGGSDWSKNLLSYAERRYYGIQQPQTAAMIDFLDNDAYDSLLAANLVFVDFYDTSANNAVIECIARSTPIVVCRHPAVAEYLGTDYPLYYDSYNDIARLVADQGRLRAAVDSMRRPEIQRNISIDHFMQSFLSSEVLKNANS